MLIGLETSKTVAAILELQFESKVSVENTWYPVYAPSKKENMVCLSSGESELMALVGVHGQLSSSGIRETQGCESTHSPRGHEGLLYAGLGDGTWTTYLEGTW